MCYDKSNGCHPRLGEVYMIDFTGEGCVQKGWRPGLIFQNNIGNMYSPNIIALPFTSAIKKVNQPTHVIVPSEVGLKKDSMILCENPECVPKECIGNYITILPDEYMEKVAIASILASSAISFIDPRMLPEIFQKAASFNDIYSLNGREEIHHV